MKTYHVRNYQNLHFLEFRLLVLFLNNSSALLFLRSDWSVLTSVFGIREAKTQLFARQCASSHYQKSYLDLNFSTNNVSTNIETAMQSNVCLRPKASMHDKYDDCGHYALQLHRLILF